MYQNGRKKGEAVLEIFSTVMIKRKKIAMTAVAASCRLLLFKKKNLFPLILVCPSASTNVAEIF